MLLQGKFEEAQKEYLNLECLVTEEEGIDAIKKLAITQLKDMEKAGVIPSTRLADVKKIIEMLEK